MSYFSGIRAVMLDWAGTTVDHGSVAPVVVLQKLFAGRKVELTAEEARRDMGLLKRDHIRTLLETPSIRNRWSTVTGRAPVAEDIDSLFEDFRSLQPGILAAHSQVIEGVAETVSRWQAQGLRVGSSTGYTREMLLPIAVQAAQQGYRPDAAVCPDDVGGGRPAPWMLQRNAQMLDVYPPVACVKIGDTVSDIEEGRNAGMWTIGITRTGNLIGLDAATWKQLSATERQARLGAAAKTLFAAGADYVAEDVAGCDDILAEIDNRLREENRKAGMAWASNGH